MCERGDALEQDESSQERTPFQQHQQHEQHAEHPTSNCTAATAPNFACTSCGEWALSHIHALCHAGNASISHIDASKVTATVTRAVLELLDMSC